MPAPKKGSPAYIAYSFSEDDWTTIKLIIEVLRVSCVPLSKCATAELL